ncbi:MAG: gamma-glutamylcyclotransferase family protein [Acholeplasmataceae bacterium]|jgi:gamma-glutamylcyclotransferase (GGCT)/AIG2-like uncharacterized protein YtfP
MKYYLAYGSNLDLDHMKKICPNAIFLGITKITGLKLAFRGEHLRSYLTVVIDKSSSVEVGIFQITNHCEKALDYYEAYPNLYFKDEIEFTYHGQIFKGLIYIMRDKYKFNLPTKEYLDMVINAFNYHKLDINPIKKALIEK